MLLILKPDKEQLGHAGAHIVAGAIRRNPKIRLGLATGSTMLTFYKELVRMHREESLDFSGIVSFNLDEYLGLPATHPESFHYFMHENFFRHVNAKPENVHIPDGTVSENYDRYCFAYEQAIRDAGGIDLQILGIGRNGHIGFNEPTSSLGSRTRIKVLTKETIDDNRKSFQPGEKVPECAVTMGIGTILEARRILLLASGSSKATSIAQAIEGPVTASVTASALQHHPDVTFIVDQEAGANLKHHDYYARVLRLTAELTPERI
ncbi:MAG TPA: glucosamine-6-phosphate deaminase [Candidatus Acidoferrum sp.]|jgi:glucosamine-6-phosphate deaminase|nr:glucosamine-6-phosphate deaminase [Candidatus Acidoferrum sp.]